MRTLPFAVFNVELGENLESCVTISLTFSKLGIFENEGNTTSTVAAYGVDSCGMSFASSSWSTKATPTPRSGVRDFRPALHDYHGYTGVAHYGLRCAEFPLGAVEAFRHFEATSLTLSNMRILFAWSPSPRGPWVDESCTERRISLADLPSDWGEPL